MVCQVTHTDIIFSILLKLDYNQLIHLNHKMIDDKFWHLKFNQDFIFGDYIYQYLNRNSFRRTTSPILDDCWKNLYYCNNHVHKIYPLLIYPISHDDLVRCGI